MESKSCWIRFCNLIKPQPYSLEWKQKIREIFQIQIDKYFGPIGMFMQWLWHWDYISWLTVCLRSRQKCHKI